MKKLPEEVLNFFHRQSFVVVSTIDRDGFVHSACKGIVKINQNGKVYLLDLYRQETFENLQRNPTLSITAVDEHKFKGYCLKGKAKTMSNEKFSFGLSKAWEERITTRITQRLLRNIRGEPGISHHPEALLPNPEYLIVMAVEKILDLTPPQLKKNEV